MEHHQGPIIPTNHLVYQGSFFRAEWHYTEDGGMPAFEYYQDLSETEQDRLDDMVRYYCDRPRGVILPKTMYNLEDSKNKIYAFKPRAERFFNFTAEGSVIVITNAYRKKTQRMGKREKEELGTAIRYRADYLRRVGEGTYYGHPGN